MISPSGAAAGAARILFSWRVSRVPTDRVHDEPSLGSLPDAGELALVLSGPLPCVVCGYELSGLSITATCPECGSAVRTTLMAVVDPEAAAFEPVIAPRVVASGMVVWSLSATLAALALWVQRGADAICLLSNQRCIWPETGVVVGSLVVLSSIGAIVLIRPFRSVRPLASLSACLGIAFCLAAAWYLYVMLSRIDPATSAPYLGITDMSADRLYHRLLIGGLLAAAVLLLRLHARALSTRSMALRRNHDNRQRLLALAAVFAFTMIGDGMLLVGSGLSGLVGDTVRTAGIIVIVVGSMLITAGIIAVFIDSTRIARSLARRPVRFSDVLRKARADEQPSS